MDFQISALDVKRRRKTNVRTTPGQLNMVKKQDIIVYKQAYDDDDNIMLQLQLQHMALKVLPSFVQRVTRERVRCLVHTRKWRFH